jgi:hypothetical protein
MMSELPERIVDGIVDDTPRLMDRDTAEYLAALFAAKTWREIRRALPETAAEIEASEYTDLGEDAPADEDEFDWTIMRGAEDGDAPVWPAQELLTWIPEDLMHLIDVMDSVFNGEFAEISESKLELLAEALRSRGIEVVRDDSLIAKAEQP